MESSQDSESIRLEQVRVFRKLNELCGMDLEKWQLVDFNLDRLLLTSDELFEEWKNGVKTLDRKSS